MSSKTESKEFFCALAVNTARLLELATYRDPVSNSIADHMVKILNTRDDLDKTELWVLYKSARNLKAIGEVGVKAVDVAVGDLRYLLHLEG